MPPFLIVLGSKNYSSWSLRPWLALEHAGVPFEEVVIHFDLPSTAAEIARYTPAGRVPVLVHGDVTIWDSLAICEYLHEQLPAARLWPAASSARAVARAVCAEMHSGFQPLREQMSMNLRAHRPDRPRSPEVEANIRRILAIWADCRGRFGAGGPFLFGDFSIADAFYAPVVTRFRTYGVALDGVAAEYAAAIEALPAMQKWRAAATLEPLAAGHEQA